MSRCPHVAHIADRSIPCTKGEHHDKTHEHISTVRGTSSPNLYHAGTKVTVQQTYSWMA